MGDLSFLKLPFPFKKAPQELLGTSSAEPPVQRSLLRGSGSEERSAWLRGDPCHGCGGICAVYIYIYIYVVCVCMYMCSCAYLIYIYIRLYIYICIYILLSYSPEMSVPIPTFVSICPSVRPSVRLSVSLSLYLSIHLSVCLLQGSPAFNRVALNAIHEEYTGICHRVGFDQQAPMHCFGSP